MGLDGVELVMALEESFGVDLKDDEVVGTVTPREVSDLIFSKLQTTDAAVCQSQRAFYILRNAFMRTFSLRRSDVSLDMGFRSLIPREEERAAWPRLQAAVSSRHWPDLSRPIWMMRLIAASSLALVALAVCVSLRLHWGLTVGLITGVALAIVFAVLAARFTIPFKQCIPARLRTVRDLVPIAITSDKVTWTREQVSALVKKVVMEQLGVPESRYTEDSHFIDDFGMG
jgi:acyl carrier protein